MGQEKAWGGGGGGGEIYGRWAASGSCKVCRVCTSSCMWEKLLLPFKIFLLCCLLSHSSEIFVARRRCHQTSLPVSLLCVCESVNYAVKYAHTRTHTHTEGETCCCLIQFIKWKLCLWFTLQVCSLEDSDVRQIVSVSAYIHYVCICTHIHIHM